MYIWYNLLMIQETNKDSKELLQKWESKLYTLLESAEQERDAIIERANELYTSISTGRGASPNLHQQTLLNEQEVRYWQLQREADSANEHIRKIEQSLHLLEAGKISENELQELIGRPQEQTEQQKQISKKRRAVIKQEDYRRHKSSYIDPDLPELPLMDPTFGPNQIGLTTGRHLKKVKGQGELNSQNAESTFHFYTADTHGGKVKHGKQRFRPKGKGGTSAVKKKIYKEKK